MLEVYIEEEQNYEAKFSMQPIAFLQQFIVDSAQEFNLDLKDFLEEICEYCKLDFTPQQLVKKLVRPIIIHNIWYLYVENNLEFARNR